MRPVTKMFWLFALLIIAAALFFVILDDEDTRGAQPAPAGFAPAPGVAAGTCLAKRRGYAALH